MRWYRHRENNTSSCKELYTLYNSLALKDHIQHWRSSFRKYPSSYCVDSAESINKHQRLLNYTFDIDESGEFFSEKNSADKEEDDDDDTYFLQLPVGYIHANVLPIDAMVHNSSHDDVFFLSWFSGHTVQDCLMYSPAVLKCNEEKPLLIMFQILKLFEFVQKFCPFLVVDPRVLKRTFFDERAWIQISVEMLDCSLLEIFLKSQKDKMMKLENESSSRDHTADSNVDTSYTDLWVCRKISNYDYLMHLNKLAGKGVQNMLSAVILGCRKELVLTKFRRHDAFRNGRSVY